MKGDSTKMKNKRASRKNHHIAAKLLCLLIALVLWIYVMDSENPDWEETFEDVPITLVNTDDIEIDNGLTIYSGYSNTVDITVRGRKNEISDITADDFTVTADVKSIEAVGEYTLPVTVSLEKDAVIASQSVDSVTVLVDKKETVTLDIKTRYSDLIIESDYSLGEPDVSVDSITVTGPSRYLSDIDYAEIAIPDLGRVTSSLTVYAKVNLIDKDGGIVTNPFVTMTHTEVSVTVPVYAYKEVPLSVQYKYGYFNSENSFVTMSAESVYVKGDAALVNALDSITVTTIDEKKVDDDETISVKLVMPDGVENLSGIEFVDVTVSNIGTTTRQMMLPIDYLVVENPNGAIYSIDDNFISVILRGSDAELYELPYLSVTPKLDLSLYDESTVGTVTVPITIEINSEYIIYELGEYSVEVVFGENAE